MAFPAGGYRYVPGVFQYSWRVPALPGWRIERVRFTAPVPLAEGFRRIETFLQEVGRPTSALCACELHSPAPFTEQGFQAFNQVYVGTLDRWGIYRNGVNPVARANTCPVAAAPTEPGFHTFCFTSCTAPDAPLSFVVAGSGEAPEGRATTATTSSRAAIPALAACAPRQSGCWARWSAEWPRWVAHGKTRPPYSSIQSLMSTLSWPMNWCAEARCAMVLRGISTARQWWRSTMKWIAARSMWNT